MGVDLTLCPDKYAEEPSGMDTWFLAYTRIALHRNYDLQAAIRGLSVQLLPETISFDWYGDAGIERQTTDPYGSPLTYLDAGQFMKIPAKVVRQCSRWNLAAIVCMQALKPTIRVVLWWH